jgi:hypothetical protein
MGAAPRLYGGHWNGLIGRFLLIAAFLWAIGLDPWSLGLRDPTALPGSAQMAARQAQAVVMGMAFLQLIVAGALTGDVCGWVRRAIVVCTGLGALLYAAGYALAVIGPPGVWLIPAGALLNFVGFALLLARIGPKPNAGVWRMVLPVICLGMLLDGAMGLFTADPTAFLPTYLGPADGVRLRMLRLARAAAIALPAVALLYEGFYNRAGGHPVLARRGRTLLWCGVASMSAILAVAALTDLRVKFLLPFPAMTAFVGTCVGIVLASRYARALEVWGWLLVAASMGVGLLMGLYAFDGPLPDPCFIGGYSDFARRLSRLGHAYCIVLGLVSIYIAREVDADRPPRSTRRVGISLLVAGTLLTIVVQCLVAASSLPVVALGAGPALVALALILCLDLSPVRR